MENSSTTEIVPVIASDRDHAAALMKSRNGWSVLGEEAASQPREGDGLERAVKAWFAALPSYRYCAERNGKPAVLMTVADVEALTAALTQRPPEQAGAVPAGWKLVPETPTTLQMVKGNAMFHRGEVPINIYRAMVSAAPNASTDTGGADKCLVERIRAAVTYQYMPMAIRKLLSEAASALSAAPTPPDAGSGSDGAGERYRHVKRGTVYEVIGTGELQTASGALVDGSAMVIYRGEDGRLWAREEGEFHDGRFEALATQPGDGGRS